MPKFHAVLIDECGSEFGAEIEANNHDEAHDLLRDNYPESCIIQLESVHVKREREHRNYAIALEDWG